MPDVRLPDLELIRRYSIAVRSEHAPAEEVLEALREDLEWLESELGLRRARSPARASSGRASAGRASAGRASAGRRGDGTRSGGRSRAASGRARTSRRR